MFATSQLWSATPLRKGSRATKYQVRRDQWPRPREAELERSGFSNYVI
jgi:hypothetical protein